MCIVPNTYQNSILVSIKKKHPRVYLKEKAKKEELKKLSDERKDLERRRDELQDEIRKKLSIIDDYKTRYAALGPVIADIRAHNKVSLKIFMKTVLFF